MSEYSEQDSLTQFSLRSAFEPFLRNLIPDAKVSEKIFSLVVTDIDRFKKFNDKFGHLFGDEILKYVASTLRLSLKDIECHFFRYGGDEFVIILPGKDAKEASQCLLRFNYNMAHRQFLFENKFFKISASCGVACFPSDGETIKTMFKKADDAMYFSKRHGRGFVTIAGRIKYIVVRNAIVTIVSVCVIFGVLFVLYPYVLKKPIRRILHSVTNIKIGVKPKFLDIITLKDGAVFKGEIAEETDEGVILSIDSERGSALMNFKRSEIKSIKYSSEILTGPDQPSKVADP